MDACRAVCTDACDAVECERAERNFSSVVTVVDVTCSAAVDHLHQGARRSASRRAVTRQQSGAKGPALRVPAPLPLLGQLPHRAAPASSARCSRA